MNTRVYKSYLGYFVLNIFIFHSSPLKAQNITTRPNVIVIMTNDLGYRDLICNGAKQIQTPMWIEWQRKDFDSLTHIQWHLSVHLPDLLF